jgi:hypothetical protein
MNQPKAPKGGKRKQDIPLWTEVGNAAQLAHTSEINNGLSFSPHRQPRLFRQPRATTTRPSSSHSFRSQFQGRHKRTHTLLVNCIQSRPYSNYTVNTNPRRARSPFYTSATLYRCDYNLIINNYYRERNKASGPTPT